MADRYALQVSRDVEASRPLGPATAAPVAATPESAHAGHAGAVERILEMQRTAGNRAVVQRLAQGGLDPAVQRVVGIDEVSTEVDAAAAAGPDAAAEGAGATGAGTEINDSTVRVNAGSIDLNAPIVRIGGVVQADTVIADSIVAANYTPGSGNVW
jgi:hypothetical protein